LPHIIRLGYAMDSILLRSFLTVHEHGSVGRAAAELGISQPALSKTIRRLEDRLQVRLFERTPAGMQPTTAGQALARHARLIAAELRNAESEVAQLRGAATGHVAVGASPAIAAALLPGVNEALWRSRPGLRVSLTEGLPEPLIAAVREGRLDCAVCTATPPHDDSELDVVPLFRDSLAVFAGAGHPLARGRPAMRALLDYPWVLSPHSGVVRHWFNSRFTAAALAAPRPQVETTSIEHIKGLLLQGTFLAFMPLQSVEAEVAADTIRFVRRADFDLVRVVAAVHRSRGRVSPGALAVIDAIRLVALARGARPAR